MKDSSTQLQWQMNWTVGGKREEKLDKVVKHMKSGLGMQADDEGLKVLLEIPESLKQPCGVEQLCRIAFAVGRFKGILKKNPDAFAEEAL